MQIRLDCNEITPLTLREIDILLRCYNQEINGVIHLKEIVDNQSENEIILCFEDMGINDINHNHNHNYDQVSPEIFLDSICEILNRLHSIGVSYNGLSVDNLLLGKCGIILNNFAQATLHVFDDDNDWVDLRKLFVSLFGESKLHQIKNIKYVSAKDLIVKECTHLQQEEVRCVDNPSAITDLRKAIKYFDKVATVHSFIYNLSLIDCILRYPCQISDTELLALSKLVSTVIGCRIYKDDNDLNNHHPYRYLCVARQLQFSLFNCQLLPIVDRIKNYESNGCDLDAMNCKLLKIVECEPYLFFRPPVQWLSLLQREF